MSFVHLHICTGPCGQEKPRDEFHRNGKKPDGSPRWHPSCKDCMYQRSKQWRADNGARSKELNSQSARRQHERAKRAVIDAYGGACTCCGESEIHFLTIEHVTEESSKRHRYANGSRISGTKLLRMIAAEGFPDDITILCHNCNCSRGQYGGCPHEEGFIPRYEQEVVCK